MIELTIFTKADKMSCKFFGKVFAANACQRSKQCVTRTPGTCFSGRLRIQTVLRAQQGEMERMAFLFNPFFKKFSSTRSNTCSAFVIFSLVQKIKCVLRLLHIGHIGQQQLAGYNDQRLRIFPVSTIFSRNTS